MMKKLTKVVVSTVAATGLLLSVTPAASAATEIVCNAAYCNATTGSGTHVTKVVGTKLGSNRGVIGFFEVFSGSLKKVPGPTTSANITTFNLDWYVPENTLVCLRFFARTTSGGFLEIGTAQCTKSKY